MKVVQINATCGSGSIGKICQEVSKLLTTKGVENYVLYSLGHSSYPLAIKYSNEYVRKVQSLYEKITGLYGFGAGITTRRLIKEIDRISPDIVHIHNIHSHDCDVEMLFNYLNNRHIKVYWTFHDCWAFTGYCPYFDMPNCDKWRDSCSNCTIYKKFSVLFDRSKLVYNKKKNSLLNANLTIITPSQWLANVVKQSFLKDKYTTVINNGIDLSIFKPAPSNFRSKYDCVNKFIILGVANVWEERKGLKDYIHLSKDLSDNFQIILVGTNEDIDKQLPPNIISIHKTKDQNQLAEIYTAADLFVIPTLEENFPTVNIEALACGTPVLTYNTGGSAEIINEACGAIVQRGDYYGLLTKILNIYKEKRFKSEDCIGRAAQYNKDDKYELYLSLYAEQ